MKHILTSCDAITMATCMLLEAEDSPILTKCPMNTLQLALAEPYNDIILVAMAS